MTHAQPTREPGLNRDLVWIVATELFVVGDILVTFVALSYGFAETNPLIHLSMAHFGPLALVALKTLGLVALAGLYRTMDEWDWVVPYWTAFAGFVLVAWNVAVLIVGSPP